MTFPLHPLPPCQVLKKTYTVSPDLLDEKSPTLTGHASSGTHWRLPISNAIMTDQSKCDWTITNLLQNSLFYPNLIAEIDWKPTMNLCMKETKKKQKSKAGKNKGQVRTVTQQEPKQSFFQYFSEPIEVTQRYLHSAITTSRLCKYTPERVIFLCTT